MNDEAEIERRIGQAQMQDSLDRNNEMTEKVYNMLVGNGGPGVLTRLALHAKSIKIQWWVLSVTFAGIIGLVIRTAF